MPLPESIEDAVSRRGYRLLALRIDCVGNRPPHRIEGTLLSPHGCRLVVDAPTWEAFQADFMKES